MKDSNETEMTNDTTENVDNDSNQKEQKYPVNTGETDAQGREIWLTKCDKCGKETKVPFKPAEGRDVFCRDCYRKQRRF